MKSALRMTVCATALPVLIAGSSPVMAGAVHDKAAKALLAGPKFKVASAAIAANYDTIVKDLITLTETPAPPYGEEVRGKLYAQMLTQAGLTDVQTDEIGNVFGYRKGTGDGPLVVIAAHLDTVFPKGTDTTVKRDGNKLSAPGIGDDTANLAALLGIIRAMNAAHYQTKSDIIFIGDVGEEGLGDVRGIRYLFQRSPLKDKIKYFISFDGGEPSYIVDGGIGVKRYKVTFNGPGGHSYLSFGLVSPAFAMGEAIAQFGKLQVPKAPKTTYNVGVVEGGTSVNTIPSSVAMTIDMRSEDQAALDAEEKALLDILPKAVAIENRQRDTSKGVISYDAKIVGLRPVGRTAPLSDIWQFTTAAKKAVGITPFYTSGSTDSNIPMSLGVQALTLGGGFKAERPHSPDEFVVLDRPNDIANIGLSMATILLLAGGS